MTVAGAAIKAGGPSNFVGDMERAAHASLFVAGATKSVPPPPLTRCSGFVSATLTAAPPTVGEASPSNGRGEKEQVMNMIQSVGTASAKVTDRVMAALVSGLEIEFGPGAGEGLALRFLGAEEIDFLWDARSEERWIGAYESLDEEDFELDCVKILGRLDGKWFVAVLMVDGDGQPHGMIGKCTFGREREARAAFAQA